jgi:hypothetical protein
MNKKIDGKLIGACGFYCGSCPDYIQGNCKGCYEQEGNECFTRSCVLSKSINFCGECEQFPCETILEKEKVTVLDKNWLRWKKNKQN